MTIREKLIQDGLEVLAPRYYTEAYFHAVYNQINSDLKEWAKSQPEDDLKCCPDLELIHILLKHNQSIEYAELAKRVDGLDQRLLKSEDSVIGLTHLVSHLTQMLCQSRQ